MTETKPEKELVKICGLREVEHALAAAEAGADLLGFVFAPSRRQVTPEIAAKVVEKVRRQRGNGVRFVGIFVNPTLSDLQHAISVASLDIVQIHGHLESDDLDEIKIAVVPTFATRPDTDIIELIVLVQEERQRVHGPWSLIDAFDPTQYGGTGKRADWNLAATVSAREPVMLAGGLNPENVGDAIRTVRPIGVDVSSGVELDGAKDSALIRAFVARARAAFADVRD